MTIDFSCQKCEAGFELDAQDMIDGTEKLACPQCDAKASQAMVDDFIAALTEMRAQVKVLSKKFAVNLAVETEDLEEDVEDEEADEDDEESDEDDELDFDDEDEAGEAE